MKNIIENFIADLHLNLSKKFDFMWPTRKNLFPHENNISISVAEIANSYDLLVYAECNVNIVGSRRDLILINQKSKWACQVEIKFNHNWDEYLEDFWRVSIERDFNSFLTHEDRQMKHSIKDYEKFGLFIAGGAKPLQNWWTNSKSSAWQNEWFSFEEKEKGISAISGFIPAEMKNDDRFGLGYFLIDVNVHSTEQIF